MKAIVCELCGSQSLTKKDDLYVCESCGTKYTAEEAKRLFVEVAVKQDNTERLENNYLLARRARENGDLDAAGKYYEAILVDDPTSWEAAFFSVYYRSASCIIRDIEPACNNVTNTLRSTFELIIKDTSADKKSAVSQVAESCISLGKGMYNSATNNYNSIDASIKGKFKHEYIARCKAAIFMMFRCGELIDALFSNEPDICPISAMPIKNAIAANDIYNSSLFNPPFFNAEHISNMIAIIDKYEPGYSINRKEQREAAQSEHGRKVKRNLAKILGFLGGFFTFGGVSLLTLGDSNGVIFAGIGAAILVLTVILAVKSGKK